MATQKQIKGRYITNVVIAEAPHPLAHSLAKELWAAVTRILEREKPDGGLAEVRFTVSQGRAYLYCTAVKKSEPATA